VQLEYVVIDDDVDDHCLIEDDTACQQAMESSSEHFNQAAGVYKNPENNEYSCCKPDGVTHVFIVRKDDRLLFFGLENAKEAESTKTHKNNTWADNVMSALTGTLDKPNKERWSGGAMFNSERKYDPNGQYTEQGPPGYRTMSEGLSLETTVRILFPPMQNLTELQQSWLNADTSRSGGAEETNAVKQRNNSFVDDHHYRLCSIGVEFSGGQYVVSETQPSMWSMYLSTKVKAMKYSLQDLKKTYEKDYGITKMVRRSGKKNESDSSNESATSKKQLAAGRVTPHTKWRKAAKLSGKMAGILRSYSTDSKNMRDDLEKSKNSSLVMGRSTSITATSSSSPSSPHDAVTFRTISGSSSLESVDEHSLSTSFPLNEEMSLLRDELTSLKGSLESLKQDILGPLKEQVETQLDDIVNRLTSLETTSK
jgi:hypothetical protein